jgi:hypothetical protein
MVNPLACTATLLFMAELTLNGLCFRFLQHNQQHLLAALGTLKQT